MSALKFTANDRLVEALLAAECPWNFVSIRQALDAVDAILCSRLDLERALHQPIHFYLQSREATLEELAIRTEQAIREIAPFLKDNDHAAKVCARILKENNQDGSRAPALATRSKTRQGLVLFLDFDGVLHPEFPWRKETMVHREIFEEAIRPFPEVDIVISSSWRHTHSLDDMRVLFSRDIAERIVHVTPPLPALRVDDLPAALSSHTRQAECEAWLYLYRSFHGPWIALDDRPQLFEPDCPRLLVPRSDIGFTRDHLPLLQSMIERELPQIKGRR